MKLPEYDNRPSALHDPSDEGDWPVLKGVFWAGVGIAAIALFLYSAVEAIRSLF